MIESLMFTCPKEALEEGRVCSQNIQNAVELLESKASGTPSEVYIEPLRALLACHEASLWNVVDFHGLSHLEGHHLSCCRTKALLEGAMEDITLPQKRDTRKLLEYFRRAAEAAGRSGHPCRVSIPGSHLGLGRSTEYTSREGQE